MISLECVLWVKIVATVFLWVLPLLLLPAGMFPRVGYPKPEPVLFAKLLGVSFLSLLVGYVKGVLALRSGNPAAQDVVANTVLVGLVSNGLSFLLLVGYGVRGTYRKWGRLARLHVLISILVTGFVTIGLLVTGR
jgi:hypothetical protein